MANADSGDLRKLSDTPLAVEPRNEQGVVALFASLCEEEFGWRITDIETRYPDCYVKDRRGKELGIELEFESSRYDHDRNRARPGPSGLRGHCDWVVCWIDNAKHDEKWRKKIRVKELSALPRFDELGPSVWIQPYSAANVKRLYGRKRHYAWTVPSKARRGDLLLVYRSGTAAAITHIMELLSSATFDRRHGWGRGFQANLRTLIEIPRPVSRDDLRREARLSEVSFIKRPTPLGQGVLAHWPAIERCLLEHNPRAGIKKALAANRPRPGAVQDSGRL